jgi:hypothetical protein
VSARWGAERARTLKPKWQQMMMRRRRMKMMDEIVTINKE